MERRITGTINNNGQRLEYRNGLLVRSIEEGLSCECTYIKCGDKDLLSSKVVSITGGQNIVTNNLYNKNGRLLQIVESYYNDALLEKINVTTITNCINGIYNVHETQNGVSSHYKITNIESLIKPVKVYCVAEVSKPAHINLKVSVDVESVNEMIIRSRAEIAKAYGLPACYLQK